jgi:hypothetical protein
VDESEIRRSISLKAIRPWECKSLRSDHLVRGIGSIPVPRECGDSVSGSILTVIASEATVEGQLTLNQTIPVTATVTARTNL